MKIAGSVHNHIHVVLGSCDTGNQDDGGEMHPLLIIDTRIM